MTKGFDAATQNEVEIQRAYYAKTAHRYDDSGEAPEHALALRFLVATVRSIGVDSILDMGSGTGRALLQFASELPEVKAVGIEPSAELREIGYSKGLSKAQLIDGDALKLAFDDNSFDLVCEFGALHHIPDPSRAVAEMLRVSRKAIFISDSNNFGQGGRLSRLFKQTINAAGLWPLADRIKTRGKGYILSESDGLAYSYSVFNDYKQIRAACASVHMLNTRDGAPDLYRSASHVALLGIKRRGGQTQNM
jgi:ubiquinone/menaquinone biosynthesis C-methylase UbiE